MSKEKISDIIRSRIVKNGGEFSCNSNISAYIEEGELDLLQLEVQEAFQEVLKSLVIDTDLDHNSIDTARRVAKMYTREIFAGRYEIEPKITSFPNATNYDQLYMVGPIKIKSTCGHHFMPFNGEAYVGVFPGTDVIGLSKFHRICKHFARRPSIQEELTNQIADAIQKATNAEGVAVLITAKHFCVCNRGVEDEHSEMVTSKLIGKLRNEQALREEFFHLVSMKRK